jgi:hypothetical protein
MKGNAMSAKNSNFESIQFPDPISEEANTFYNGRNGFAYCRGIELMRMEHGDLNAIRLYPLNSKGSTSSCYVDIPRSEIPNLISKLQSMA